MNRSKSLLVAKVVTRGALTLFPLPQAILAGPVANAAIVISDAATENMDCSSGVCAPTASDAVLNVTDLENLLASGNSEVTTTGSGGVQADNIDVDAPLSWSSANTLALDAYDSIAVGKAVSISGTGGLSLVTNDGGSAGVLSFGRKGNVGFQNLSSALSINGTTFALVNSIASLASAVAANPNGAYALASNYDASQDGIYANSPVGATLAGTVQGLGNTISNLSIDHQHTGGNGYLGMFAIVGSTGTIENLRLNKISYRSTGRRIGVGGLVGENEGYLIGDQVAGAIKTTASAGGLLLVNSASGSISLSSANVRVKGKRGVGAAGLVVNNEGSISLSHADGAVVGWNAAGFVDLNEGTISQSFETGNVDSGTGGGFVNEQGGTIDNSYATGAVGGGSSGGFVADGGNSAVTASYSSGALATGRVGGFVCEFSGNGQNFSDDYWDTKTSGTRYGACDQINIAGITGLTTRQLRSGLPAGFDSSIWAEKKNINNGFPYLINNPPEK